jgi:hypothetical protein
MTPEMFFKNEKINFPLVPGVITDEKEKISISEEDKK